MTAWAVLVAAGKGTRAGFSGNKVFQRLGGKTVLSRALEALEKAEAFEGIVLVISKEDEAAYEDLKRDEGPFERVKFIAHGGETRQESVFNGLKSVPEGVELVAIHDAARPFATAAIFQESLCLAQRVGSGVISHPVADTIKQIDPETGRTHTPNRSELRAVQTPQSFRLQEILRAHSLAAQEGYTGTDDAQLYEKYIGPVRLFSILPDAYRNIKLTTREDFLRFQRPLFRVGTGYDAHRLVRGRRLVLCGVEVPHDRGLDGHSDADVATHALMDAILGALGEGDIGRHFPDTDDRYRGISSMKLLKKVMDLVRKQGYRVENADVTIVAQKPKLLAYLDAMRLQLSAALDCPAVNVKATTTERMGFEGEEQGISAQAVVLLAKEDM
ncbi:MAG TPA: 2-C-methyl-D-erythritol 2,4-cyclodiphosphate synthase [Candidatus Pullichristensenella excrementigallinarum]|uniref:Bifunctional enzyme IspD/IspF n=1 Tax=Candidatus Pullichristensenella excrementigallinarum TaxID=2840907 RepID=A0A9D1LCM0_9FIRM|nr:2-C-methyl-D-erythritol 2,4-cyclodiphosphate synthase [Candidatus Pullichristensenella excrementigallinarum]